MAAFRRQVFLGLSAAVALWAVAGCRGPGGPQNQANSGNPQGGAAGQGGGQGGQAAPGAPQGLPHGATQLSHDAPFGDDPVSWLDLKYKLELPRSTQTQAIALPWQDVTPAAAPGSAADAGAKPAAAQAVEHRWTEPVLLLGRGEVATGEGVIGKLRCQAEPHDLCTEAGLRAPTGRQRLDFDPAEADANGLPAWLVKAVAGQDWKGKPVLLLADRRVAAQAVLQAQTVLLAAGAEPRLTVATLAGALAYALPPQPHPPTLLAFAPTTAVSEVDAAPDRVPRDLTAVVVEVSTTGMHLILLRPEPHPPITPELLGDVVQALNVWAERARTTAPELKMATIRAAADAPWEEVARAIDGLRDTCARAAKGTPCHDHRPLFAWISLHVQPAPAPAAVPAPAGVVKPAAPM
ncbi:MAG: hypothetical protein HY902_21090 [Deltaproteobacteria bacterium]|nr:hypothetical protein [Deltaproteobacteria bacterium]